MTIHSERMRTGLLQGKYESPLKKDIYIIVSEKSLFQQLNKPIYPGSYLPWGHVRGAWLEGGSPPVTGEMLVPLIVVRQNHTPCRALTVAAPH
jgi:hypothetical protein